MKGGLYVVAATLSAFIIASLLEYLGHFNPTTRSVLFFSFALFSAGIFGYYIVRPLLKLYRMGSYLSYQDAAVLVGKHFPEVNDRLLNTLQLHSVGESNPLLIAAIEQKTKELKPVPFQQAIDFKANMRYVKYAIVPVVVLITLFLIAPGFKDSSQRLVNYSRTYIPQAPFHFNVLNKSLECLQHDDLEIILQTSGKVIPADASILVDGKTFKMKRDERGVFSYVLKRLAKNTDIRFEADGYSSETYTVDVVPKPTMIEFSTQLDYPAYTGLTDEKLKNTTDLTVPAGTQLTWKFNVRNAEKLIVLDRDNQVEADQSGSSFSFRKLVKQAQHFLVRSQNQRVEAGDSVLCNIQVIPDAYPTIEVEEKPDSLRSKLIYLVGKIGDDYGFRQLTFNYRFINSEDASKKGKSESMSIRISPNQKSQAFYHIWDLDQIGVGPSDVVEYYFEVWDNDGVNGSKSARTGSSTFEAPSIDKINEETQKKTDEIKSDIKDRKNDLNDLEKDILELEQKMTEKKQLTWEEKKKIQELLDKHEKLEKDLQNIIDENKKNNARENEFKPIDQEIQDKQEQIEELFNEVMNEEMKELMKEIEKLMQENKKDQLMQHLDEMKFNDKQVEKQLDRMLEQLKQLQLEKKVNETVEKLEKLAKEQKTLSEETEKSDQSAEKLEKKQEELNQKFEDVKKDMKDIDKKNKELEKPLDIKEQKDQESQDKIDKEQEESQENLQKNNKKKAAPHQKKAADEMEQSAQKLNQQMQAAMKQQEQEDYNTLREILDNLVQVSKDQEALMEEFKLIRGYNPKYVELGQQQKKLRDDARMIEDSLLALSKRVKQVEHFINEEIGKVNDHMNKALHDLSERHTGQVINHQQYIMTSMNNLALMLSESLRQMQEQMQSKPGSGSCNNPGNNSKPNGAQSMREMQEGMKKMLEKMHQGMQDGGQKPSSKDFAEAAAMQAAIRKKLQDMKRQLEKEGKRNSLGDLGKTEEMMDDLERDLYNKRMNSSVITRQQEILTRLLEHEKAEREQEQDNKRKSNEGKEIERKLPPAVEEYLKQKQREQELLKTLPPDLSPYYRDKVREYFNEIGNQPDQNK